MNKFQQLYNEILLEMPYLFDLDNDHIPNDKEHFDLELEKVQNRKELTKYIYKLLFSRKKTDKYGNSIFIDTPEVRKRLLIRLMNNVEVLAFIKRILKLESTHLARAWLLHIEKQLSQKIGIMESKSFQQISQNTLEK